MDSTTTSRWSCLTEEDDGLAFIADMEAGFSGKTHHGYGGGLQRRGSFRNLSLSSSSSMRIRFDEGQNRPHFLEACFLCEKSLRGNDDIFMYRGDIPFCSDDCRQEQIEIEELKEKKRWNLLSMRSSSSKGKRNSTSPNKSRTAGSGGDYPFHTGTVVA